MCVKFYLIQFGFAVITAICLGSLFSGPSVHAKYKTERKDWHIFGPQCTLFFLAQCMLFNTNQHY